MIKCIIFDLDNTLFDQTDHIKDLMVHLASILSKKYNLDENTTSKLLISYWMEQGPFYSHFFDDILKKLSINKDEVKNLIDISHSYQPKISTYPKVKMILAKLKKKYHLAMITDGNKSTQKNKINSLDIKKYFTKIVYATGKNMKPKPKAYLTILNHFKLKPEEIIYVGDNPTMDFITPNKMKMTTVRVLTGYFKNLKLNNDHEATFTINNLIEIFDVLSKLQRN